MLILKKRLTKNELFIYLSLLFLVEFILMTQSVYADEVNYPNMSISSTYTYSLDLDGNCELYSIFNLENLDDNFYWTGNETLRIPFTLTSFSLSKMPNVTFISFMDKEINFTITNSTLLLEDSNAYRYLYYVNFFPPADLFPKNGIVKLRIKTKINNASIKSGDNYIQVIYPMDLPRGKPPFKYYLDSFTIKVNLPNNPYYWAEVLDTKPKYDYRTSFGRGESIEWKYFGNQSQTDLILIDYRIHIDTIKEDLDNATKSSLEYAKKADKLGDIALFIAIISIPSVIWSTRDLKIWLKGNWYWLKRDLIIWLKGNWNRRP